MTTARNIHGRGAIAPADGNVAPSTVLPSGAPLGNHDEAEESFFGVAANGNEREISRSARNDSEGQGGAIEAATDLGPNNERLEELKPKLVNALRDLVRQYREEGVVARRHEIRRIRQARLFWQGLQYSWWNPNDMNWHLPFEQRFADDRSLAEMPRYQFVTNFYQGFGLSFIAVLSQDVPSVRFYPQSAQSLEDISAARAASDVAQLIEQNNHVEHLLTLVGYHLWTDGKLGGYVRYVADGQRFGFHDEHELEAVEIPLGEDVYVCPSCGKETPASSRPSARNDRETVCPGCGAALGEANLRKAERVTVPRVVGTRRVANGQEVISIIGGLELNTPVWANEMHEYPYLQWQAEVHRAKLKAAYPHAADKIEVSPSQGAEDVYARVSRLSVSQGLPSIHPGDALVNLITFDRTWIRPWAFYALEDKEVREELLALFPDGCYAAFAGDAYCESRSETMDDHWRVLHALPGDGQNRPSVGDSLVQVQERYNVLSNMQAETYEYGIPPIYADPQVLDFDALANQVAEPAAHFPARARPGQPLAAGFFQPVPAQVPPDMIRHQQDLIGPVAQFLTGLFPAIFGGNMEDVKTASGYALARDQAMGRLGLVWRRTKQFYADLMLLSVDTFRKSRPEDAEIPLLGPDGVFDSRLIRLADLKGNIQAHPEADETFPRLKSQQRGVLQQLFSINDPVIQRALTEPANIGYIKNVMGLNELVVPGEDSRNKQLREIQQLLASAPIIVPTISPVISSEARNLSSSGGGREEQRDSSSPVAGAAAAPNDHEASAGVLLLPSVPVDELLDDHASEFEECKRWANSDAGQSARMTNPAGFANVRAHAQAHLRAMAHQRPANS
jgi:DNA-directed RNA polymerase subunit RPC12/RpoP